MNFSPVKPVTINDLWYYLHKFPGQDGGISDGPCRTVAVRSMGGVVAGLHQRIQCFLLGLIDGRGVCRFLLHRSRSPAPVLKNDRIFAKIKQNLPSPY
jgi:hypothetical protein